MKQRKLKKEVVYGLYAFGFAFILCGLYLIDNITTNSNFKNNTDTPYVNKTIFEEDVPVVNVSNKIIRPYLDEDVKLQKSYYDYQADNESQKNSILYYEKTYLQNSGCTYNGKEHFDVVAVLDGTVTSVKEDELLGKIVEIKHDNNIISVYESLSEITVKENDVVTQNTVIGKSGEANIAKDLKDHLHFELIINGSNVNPEEYYDKNVSEIQ